MQTRSWAWDHHLLETGVLADVGIESALDDGVERPALRGQTRTERPVAGKLAQPVGPGRSGALEVAELPVRVAERPVRADKVRPRRAPPLNGERLLEVRNRRTRAFEHAVVEQI